MAETIIEAWARATVAAECKRVGVSAPAIRIRFAAGGVRVQRLGHSGPELLAKYPERVRLTIRKDYCGGHQTADMCWPIEIYHWLTPRIVPIFSSGRCHYGNIWRDGYLTMTFGSDLNDRRMVILHELAHWLKPDENHSPAFFKTAFALYRKYELNMDACAMREGRYKKRNASREVDKVRREAAMRGS